jgi:hypothetical protein
LLRHVGCSWPLCCCLWQAATSSWIDKQTGLWDQWRLMMQNAVLQPRHSSRDVFGRHGDFSW